METKLLGKLIDGTIIKIARTEAILENGEHRSKFSFEVDGATIDLEVDLPKHRTCYRHFTEMGMLASHGFASVSPA